MRDVAFARNATREVHAARKVVLQRGVDQLLIAAPALQARRQPSRVRA